MNQPLVYSSPGNPNKAAIYTFTAGEGLTYDDAMKWAYISGSPIQLWIEPASGNNASPGAPVLTGDQLYIAAPVPDVHYLNGPTFPSQYVRWSILGGETTWQIFFSESTESGLQIPCYGDVPFVLWNVSKNLPLSPGDQDYCILGGSLSPWGFTAQGNGSAIGN